MNKEQFLKKHELNEQDYKNLIRFEQVRENGAYNMYEYLALMKNHNVNGGEKLATWIQKDDNYGDFLETLETLEEQQVSFEEILTKITKELDDKYVEVEVFGEEIEFSFYTPAGEDFRFTSNKDNFFNETINYCKNFDREEHVEMWVKAREEKVVGIPSLFNLVEDSKHIQEKLEEIKKVIEKYRQ